MSTSSTNSSSSSKLPPPPPPPPLVAYQEQLKVAREGIKTQMLLQAKHEEFVRNRMAKASATRNSKPSWLLGLGLLACTRSIYDTVMREVVVYQKDEDVEEEDGGEERQQQHFVGDLKETPSLVPSLRIPLFAETTKDSIAASAAAVGPIQNESNVQYRRDFLEELRLRDEHNGASLRLGVLHGGGYAASRSREQEQSLLIPTGNGGEHIYLPQ